ncbi:MAG: cytidylate kinase-like family protein [Oscillospiraceae bacterium]|nr:cytidylate kinase-like family protein [Oscillospiraceae bacterium]
MKCNFVAIEREYGSGGTKIARRLGQQCGIPCYGKEILEQVARERNLSVDRIQQYEEHVSNSLLYTLSMITNGASNSALSPEDDIFLSEQEVIQHLAEAGPTIFLGHCASEALRNRTGVVRVFIRAEEAEKKKRIREDYGIPEDNIERLRKRFDKKRANYYFANTARQWIDPANYDIVLNSTYLGLEGCVRLLCALFHPAEE